MRKTKVIAAAMLFSLTASLLLAGCGGKTNEPATSGTQAAPSAGTEAKKVNAVGLEDGVYTVDVETDSSMFHINEAMDGKGELTVEDGVMKLHITLASKKIVNMYMGTKEEAEAAEKAGEALIDPVEDTVTYEDGDTDEVYGFIFPIETIGEPITVAIIGTHDNWYTHEVTVRNPVPKE